MNGYLTSIPGKFDGGIPIDHFDDEQRVARGGHSREGRGAIKKKLKRTERLILSYSGVDLVLDNEKSPALANRSLNSSTSSTSASWAVKKTPLGSGRQAEIFQGRPPKAGLLDIITA